MILKISKLKTIKPRIPKWRSLHFRTYMHITIIIIFVIYVNKMPANLIIIIRIIRIITAKE